MAGESTGFRQLERVNRRRTAALVAKLILLLAICGLILDFLFHTVSFRYGELSGFPWYMTAALAFAVALSMRANFSGADQVLGEMRAHPISPDGSRNQTVIDVVREMAIAARIPVPRIDLIDDPSPNAFAIGRDPDHSVICVTQGLLDQMDREELQGVVGHEMAHIRNFDTRLTTMVTAMFGGFGVFSGRLISIMLSREREYLADASAVELTRNPTALIRALEHIAKTESPLTGATPGTAQLFIVDPLQSASGGGGRTYEQFINEITRIRSQSDKTEEQRDAEAKNFAAHEYPRNFVLEKISSHPPLADRIARLQALISKMPGAAPGVAAPSDVTDDQRKAKFAESAQFVRDLAAKDPEVLAKTMQAALLASGPGRAFLEAMSGGTQSTPRDPLEQKLYEANLAAMGDSPPPRDSLERNSPQETILTALAGLSADKVLGQASAADPAGSKGIGQLDSAATEQLERAALAKFLAPVTASMAMQAKRAAAQPAPAERRSGSSAAYLFWIVIALSAGAIITALAAK